MRILQRRLDHLWRKADKIVEECNGDIYGADLKTFKRWSAINKEASTIAYCISLMLRDLETA